MQKSTLFLFLCLSVLGNSPLFAQQKISFNLSVGRTVGFSQFIPTEGYTPYFTSYADDDLGYDLSFKYYFNPKTAVNVGINYYIRQAGVRLIGPAPRGMGERTNIELGDDTEWMYVIDFQRRLAQSKRQKFELWFSGGVGLEYVQNRFTQLGGFEGLLLLDYETKENWYALLNTGIAAKWKLGNHHHLGLKLIGGLGLVHRNYFFYEGTYDEELYYGVSRTKGDYMGLLATYEYSFSLKKRDDKSKRKKRKKRR